MARNLTAGFIAEATASSNRPIVLFEGLFNSGTVRLANTNRDLSWNSQTWLGNGWFQGIEAGDETIEVEATTITILLSGVPGSVISLVLSEQKQGATGLVYIGFLDGYGAVVDSPYQWWKGKYSHAEIDYGSDDASVRLHYESPLVDLNRPNEKRWNDQSQQRLFPGDRGFEYVIAAANWHGQWGNEKKKLSSGDRRRGKGGRGTPPRNRRPAL